MRKHGHFLKEYSSLQHNFLILYFFFAVLSLHCVARAFSWCGEQGLLFSGSAQPFLRGGLSYGAQARGINASVAAVHGLIYPMARGIFLDQGSNLCPLHWQADC